MNGWQVLAAFASCAALSPLPAMAEVTAERRVLTREEAALWQELRSPVLTRDGRWLVYMSAPVASAPPSAHVDVHVRSLDGRVRRRYRAGTIAGGAGQFALSPSGRWLAFTAEIPTEPRSGRRREGVALIDLATGARRDFPDVARFAFAAGDSLVLAYVAPAGSLRIEYLAASRPPLVISDAAEFALSPDARQVAYLRSSEIAILEIGTGLSRVIEHADRGVYTQLAWSASGGISAELRNDGARDFVFLADTDRPDPRRSVVAEGRLPTGYALPAAPNVVWRDELDGVYLELFRNEPRQDPDYQSTPGITLWHSRDEVEPAARRAEAVRRRTEWAYQRLGGPPGSLLLLNGSDLEQVVPQRRGAHALGYGLGAHGHDNRTLWGDGSSSRYQLRDYSLVELATGRHVDLARRVGVQELLGAAPQLSPDGRYFLYQDERRDYVAIDVALGSSRNLTSGLPVRFDDTFDQRTGLSSREYDGFVSHLQGWSRDGTSVLLSDGRDVWLVPLGDGHAVNLTGNGRTNDISYSRRDITNPDGRWPSYGAAGEFDASGPLYFDFFDRTNGETGVARRSGPAQGLRVLQRQFAQVTLYRARDAEAYYYIRESAVSPADLFQARADWSLGRRLSDFGAQTRPFLWPSEVRYLSYITSHGDRRHALARLPAGFQEGRAYPTIVSVYKVATGATHTFRMPFATVDSDWTFTRAGYVSLNPDIYTRIDEPGPAALESVLGAVDAAVGAGFSDPGRLGITGHSYGGYETAYIISQTDRFRAAVAYAPAYINLWSSFGATSSGMSYAGIMVSNQPYMSGNWWEIFPAYLANSPLYHSRNIRTPLLIAHGTADEQVPFAQSLELFTTLRRLGNQSVVLLEYAGAPHSFEHQSMALYEDFEGRSLAFFDHHLKGAPSPRWWQDGLSRWDGQVPAH